MEWGQNEKKKKMPWNERVSGRNGFTFTCHDATNVRNKERGREKDNQKSTNKIQYNKYRNLKVRMHEHVTCKYNASWAQPNPNLTAHNIATK